MIFCAMRFVEQCSTVVYTVILGYVDL